LAAGKCECTLIEDSQGCKRPKPFCRFSRLSPSTYGVLVICESMKFDQYDKLYADASFITFSKDSYFAPQLLTINETTTKVFPVLLGWYAKINTMKARAPLVGISVGRDTG